MMNTQMTKRLFVTMIAAFLFVLPGFSQYTASEVKKVEKSKALYNKKKYDKAIATLKPVLNVHPYEDELWNLRVVYEADRYDAQFVKDLTVILKHPNKDGTYNFNENSLKKSSEYKRSMLAVCYSATVFCSRQEYASILLRNKLVDHSVDTAVKDDAKEEFSKGEEDFKNQNYTSAIKHYQKAVDIDPSYYKARLYIGDSYFNDGEYEKSIPWFQDAIKREPELLEPRKYLTDAYMKLKQWDNAYKACIEGIAVYSDIGMFIKLEEICEKQGKSFNRHWMPRTFMPNVMDVDQDPIADGPWKYYREAKDKIARYCNDQGVITKSQSLTQQKYMEVYCWEYMLKKSEDDDKEFGFARKMMDEGYLDCFVLVSMHHITFQDQAHDFSTNNSEKIKKYFDTYLVK